MELKECLQKIDWILEDYFETQNEPKRAQEIHHHHHHHHSSSPWFFFHNPSPSVIVVNPQKEEVSDEKEHKDDSFYKVVAAVSGVAVSLIGTYVIAKDEYMKYLMSNLDKEIATLTQICLNSTNRGEILDILENYRIWKCFYETRTRPKLCAKATTIGSSFVGLGGLYMMSSSLMLGGLFGVTGSACFLLWKHLTNKPRSEETTFADLKARVKFALTQEQEPGAQPSAYNPASS